MSVSPDGYMRCTLLQSLWDQDSLDTIHTYMSIATMSKIFCYINLGDFSIKMTIMIHFLLGSVFFNKCGGKCDCGGVYGLYNVFTMVSRQMVVWPRNPTHHTMSIFTGRNKMRFSHIRTSMLPSRIGIIFYCKFPPPSAPHIPRLPNAIMKYKPSKSSLIPLCVFFFL